MSQTYALARRAGFDPPGAVIMAAVAAGESGLNPAAVGDVDLQSAQWGPSVGLPQIRTLKSETGTGGTRDIARLRNDPLAQMVAAYEISGHGRDFTPWTVYTSGRYRTFLGQANTAASSSGGVTVPGVNVVAAGSSTTDGGSRVQALAVLGVVVVLGVGLVVVGAARATGAGPVLGRLGKRAAMVAAL